MSKVLKGSLLTCLCLGVLACQSRHALVDQPLNSYPEYITSGDILPIASITTIDSVDIDLHRTDKKKLVVLFATWCSDSNRLLTALNNSALLTDKSLQVIAIAREDDEKVVKAWRNKHNIKMAIALDEDRSIYKRFAGGGIPRIITVNEDNQVIKMNLAEGQAPLSKVIWH